MTIVAPPSAVRTGVRAPSTQIVRRVDIFQSDGTTIWKRNVELKSGSVSVDQGRDERRTLDLTLRNADNSLSPSYSGFWYDKIIKVYRGIRYRSAPATPPNYGLPIMDGSNLILGPPTRGSDGSFTQWETQIGEFMIDSIDQPHFPFEVKVTGRDYTKKLLTSKFLYSTTFAKGTPIENAIKAIAINGGIAANRISVPTTTRTLGRDFVFERGDERWKAMHEIAVAYNYDIFFDAAGFLKMQTQKDPATSSLIHTFRTGANGDLVSYNKRSNDNRLYNSIIATGESNDMVIPVWASAKNTNPSSPTRISRIGERVYQYTSAFLETTAQCQEVANQFLKIHSLESFEINLQSVVIPWLDVGEIIRFVDPNPSPTEPDRFLLSSFSIPLSLEPMSAIGKRVQIVG